MIVYITKSVGAVQVNGKKIFKHLPFITRAWNLGKSKGIYIDHNDDYILGKKINLMKLSL